MNVHHQSEIGRRSPLPAALDPVRRRRTVPVGITHPSAMLSPAVVAVVLGLTAGGLHLRGAEIDLKRLPAPAAGRVEFDRDIRPIFESACFRCHGPEKPKSHFRLDDRAAALKGGDNGVSIVPGNSAESSLIHYVAGLVEDMEMPPEGKGDKLTPEQIGLLRAWIDQGAEWGAAVAKPVTVLTLTPAFQYFSVDGNQARFREHLWMTEDAGAGIDSLRWQERFGDKGKITYEGRAMTGQEDYRGQLTIEKEELGFVRTGFSHFRSYYDDLGGFYEPFGVSPFASARDLHIDHTRAWLDFGITLPEWPRMVFGYEFQGRNGEKSTLQWGGLTDAAFNTKAVLPGFKAVDETVHILKLDVSHTVWGVQVEDSFRAEFYDHANQRTTLDSYTIGQAVPDAVSLHNESYDHFNASNSLRLERQIKDWWLLSGGYLYSHLDGNAGFNQLTLLPFDPTLPPFIGDTSQQIVLGQRSHVFNLNTMLGPWEGLTFTAGVQSDWTKQHGLGNAFLVGGAPAAYGSDTSRATVQEQFGLRYTAIPLTTLFAEARFAQEKVDQFESQGIDEGFDDERDFMRDTDARGRTQDYRAGFMVSPWKKTSFQLSGRHRDRSNNYDHLTDSDLSAFPGNGYPSLLSSRDTETQEVEAKLVLHPMTGVRTTLKYAVSRTDYTSVTADVTDPFPPNPLWPGGATFAGNQDAHTYSANLTLNPLRRLYWSTTFSYSDTRIVSGIANGAEIAPYAGDVYTVVAGAHYILSQTVDLTSNYTFSYGDYEQANAPVGIPLGIRFERHGVIAGIVKRWRPNISSKLQYGYFTYDEPSSGGFANYTAHGILGSISVAIP